jgi:hypothetical protein
VEVQVLSSAYTKSGLSVPDPYRNERGAPAGASLRCRAVLEGLENNVEPHVEGDTLSRGCGNRGHLIRQTRFAAAEVPRAARGRTTGDGPSPRQPLFRQSRYARSGGTAGSIHLVGFSPFRGLPAGRSVACMVESERGSFVAECFWPGVDDADLATLDRRIERVIAELATERAGVLPPLLITE